MSILLTLSAGSVTSLIGDNGSSDFELLDLPQFAIKQLELRGLNLPASMLSGWPLDKLDRLRDQADKAACPCLVLIEDQPLAFGDPKASVREAAADRVHRLAVAANRLGCNALAIRADGADNDEVLERIAAEVKSVMPRVERLELNVLLMPGQGLTESPDRLTELIKRVGGFRIGSLPTFAHAAACGDPVDALRKLAPYAGAVHATVEGFSRSGGHKGYDLSKCVRAIRSVGFVNTLAIDYVGKTDPIKNIEKARDLLQAAIDSDDDKDAEG